MLRKAGLKRALVSSSGDDGTQRLVAEAPELIVPSLRPYRSRGEIGSWVRDDSVVAFLEERLQQCTLCGDRRVPPLRRRCRPAGAAAHGGAGPAVQAGAARAHADADAVERLFQQDPQARILWAHSGFERPEQVAEMLRKHKNLWCDLAFRSDHGSGGKVAPEWRAAVHRVPRPLHGRHRHLHARALALHRRARQLVARLAGRPAAAAGRTHRLAQWRGAVRASGSRAARNEGAGCWPALLACWPPALRWPAAKRWAPARSASTRPGCSWPGAPTPAPIPVGRHFAHRLVLCPRARPAPPAEAARRRDACPSTGTA